MPVWRASPRRLRSICGVSRTCSSRGSTITSLPCSSRPWTRSLSTVRSAELNVTADTARRFLVARHLLAPARSLEGGPDAVLEVFRRLGSIQFDPLAVAGRHPDLVLPPRLAG